MHNSPVILYKPPLHVRKPVLDTSDTKLAARQFRIPYFSDMQIPSSHKSLAKYNSYKCARNHLAVRLEKFSTDNHNTCGGV